MDLYVTLFEAAAPEARSQVALMGGGLLAVGLLIGWMIRRWDWGAAQFVAAVLVFLGVLFLLSLLREPGQVQPRLAEGLVSGYTLRGGQACFLVAVERFCASYGLPVRDAQRLRILHAGETILRVEVAKESQMSPEAVMAREQERIRAEGRTKQPMMRGLLFSALGLFTWMAVNWRRAMVLFCGFVGWNLVSMATVLMGGAVFLFFRAFLREAEERRQLGIK